MQISSNNGLNFSPEKSYHCLTAVEVATALQVDLDKGLSTVDVYNRLSIVGPNQLESHSNHWWKILLEQFLNAMTIILLIAMIISFVFKDWVEAGVIMFVVVANTIVGFYQEYNAEHTMESLKNMSSPTAKVIRNISEVETVPAKDLVPGDIVTFEEGDVIPADCRLVKVFHLKLDEALLTGESVPIEKK
jgi:P-type Na+/K+ transporter